MGSYNEFLLMVLQLNELIDSLSISDSISHDQRGIGEQRKPKRGKTNVT